MTSPEEIDRSRKIAKEFIKKNLPTHEIRPVAADGFCIIHAYREARFAVGWVLTFEELIAKLRDELTERKDFYNSKLTDGADILTEFEEYVINPLSKYDKDVADYFIYALGSAYKVNVTVFQSDDETCKIIDQTEDKITYDETCFFVRTLSLHWDPVVPIAVFSSDSDVEITGHVPPSQTTKTKVESPASFGDDSDIVITNEIPRQQSSNNSLMKTESASSSDDFSPPRKLFRKPSSVQLSSKFQSNFRFCSSDSDSDDAVTPVTSTTITPNGTVTSPYESAVHYAYHLHTLSLGDHYTILSANNIEGNDHINPSSIVPWHVTKSCAIIVDLHKLPSVDDLTYDCWWWENLGTYTVVSDSVEDAFRKPFTEEDIGNKLKVVRRTYRCKDDRRLQKAIIATYPKGVNATKQGFGSANRFAVVEYIWDGKENIPGPIPGKKKRVYPSVKADVQNKSILGGKKASFSSLVSRGGLDGIRNSSEVIGRKQAYYQVSKSATKPAPDPLKNLIKKFQEEGKNGVIRNIQFNETAYDIVLCPEICVKNIANFCCNDSQPFRSPLSFDFSFDFGKKTTPFYVFVGTYRNTSLFTKGTTTCPVMLGPMLMCHTKGEPSSKKLCEELTAACEGLSVHLKVIGADGEKSIHNQCLRHFQAALLLLCFKHTHDNVADYMTKNLSLSMHQKQEVLDELFGSGLNEGITDAETPSSFVEKMAEFYRSLIEKFGEEGKKLVAYLRNHKESSIQHHVTKFAVENARICEGSSRFYNNASESVNKMLSSWTKGKLDLERFVSEYESFVKNQKWQVMQAFMNMPSDYVVRPEFSNSKLSFEADYATKSVADKRAISESLVNQLIDPKIYKDVLSYRAGPTAVEASRKKVDSMMAETTPGKSAGSQVQQSSTSPSDSVQLRSNSVPTFDLVYFKLMELVDGDAAAIRGSVAKAMELLDEKKVLLSPCENTVTVWPLNRQLKGTGRENIPHVITISNQRIICKCQNFNKQGFCSHTIATALYKDIFDIYAESLRQKSETLTTIASKNIDPNVGKKKPSES